MLTSNNPLCFESLKTLNHRHVLSCDSTSSELINAIKEGALHIDEPHLFTAETQNAGRGQRGRSWQSPLGNAYLSLYHPVRTPINGLLSSIIGVALAKMPVIQTLNKQLIAQNLIPIGVKWANDLGFYETKNNNKDNVKNNDEYNIIQNTNGSEPRIIYFKKLAGILIEPVWQAGKLVGVVIGVGINVQATPKLTTQTLEGMTYQAISLQDIYQLLEHDKSIAPLPTLQQLYEQMSAALLAALTTFEALMSEHTTDIAMSDFLGEFEAVDALSGLRLKVSQNHNGEDHVIKGDACGINTNGCLQLRQDNGKLAALFTGRIDVIERR